ncbi:MAG: hypothetical protein IPK83_20000 [Planctomycetes bacterium]|nr:hypothetical protein [Planctomycetota bacterium]
MPLRSFESAVKSILVCSALFLLSAGASPAMGQDPLPAGFTPHIRPTIKVDDKGQLSGIRNGQVRLEGVVKGHKTYLVQWQPNDNPPRCKVKIRVPIWESRAASSVIYEQQRGAALRRGGRVALINQQMNVDEVYLVIDARGSGIEPCLFPVVTDNTGRVIYDVSTIRVGPAQMPSPVQYVETRMTIDQLEAWADLGFDESMLAGGEDLVETGSEMFAREMFGNGFGSQLALPMLGPEQSGGMKPAASQPSTRPADGGKRRRKRVVKAVKMPAKGETKIVLTKEDAEKLRTTPEGASLLRSGRVIVVVDSVAAGIQGRGSEIEDGDIFASNQ